MRTTLDLNSELVAQAKATAVRERTTLTRLVEEGLALRLRPTSGTGQVVALPVFDGGSGLLPAVEDALTNRALWDAMEEGEGPHGA
ncbi:MAG: DUF2191 domain-containing protein [Armatimonadetes bacterium]|nr:DUF2191 domain-containing protein [Armatimonadota bacterium]